MLLPGLAVCLVSTNTPAFLCRTRAKLPTDVIFIACKHTEFSHHKSQQQHTWSLIINVITVTSTLLAISLQSLRFATHALHGGTIKISGCLHKSWEMPTLNQKLCKVKNNVTSSAFKRLTVDYTDVYVFQTPTAFTSECTCTPDTNYLYNWMKWIDHSCRSACTLPAHYFCFLPGKLNWRTLMRQRKNTTVCGCLIRTVLLRETCTKRALSNYDRKWANAAWQPPCESLDILDIMCCLCRISFTLIVLKITHLYHQPPRLGFPAK